MGGRVPHTPGLIPKRASMMSSVRRLFRLTLLAVVAAAVVLLPSAREAGAQTKSPNQPRTGIGAQPRPTPKNARLIVDPVNEAAGFAVRVWVDRPERNYAIGDEVKIFVASEQPGY